MRKFLLLLFLLTTPFVYGDEEPDNDRPVFEEVDETQNFASKSLPFQAEAGAPQSRELYKCDKPKKMPPQKDEASYLVWERYKVNFGIEKLFMRFPTKPVVQSSYTDVTAYAFDGYTQYSFSGYYPPQGNIDPLALFDDILYNLSLDLQVLLLHQIFQTSDGDWVMDYVTQDLVDSTVTKGRTIVTPFNAYTLMCNVPFGVRDYFDYFLDNFWIQCHCNEY